MELVTKPAIDRLRSRIRAVLQRSFQWVAWQRALEVTFLGEYLAKPGSHSAYCVDTSLIIEYLLPGPFKYLAPGRASSSGAPSPESYPRPLDLALLLLFDPQRSIGILPPHHQEFLHRVQEWQRRLAVQKAKLDLFQAALDRLVAVVEANGEGAIAGDRFRNFIDAVLSEEGSFAGILALETQGARSISAIIARLQVVARDSLATLVKDWTSSNARDRIDALFNALSTTSKGRETPSTTRVDAHALYLLEQENERLPENFCLILLTESAKIWSFLSSGELREALKFRNQRGNVWLIQPPEVVLVSALVEKTRAAGEGEAGEREARRLLILDLEQNKRLRVIRDEVEHEILPRLDELAGDPVRWKESQLRVNELEQGLKKLNSVSQDRDRLLTLRLGLDAQENWGGTLFRTLRSLRDAPQRELRSTLSWELERLRKRVWELEQQMLIATPPPTEDAVFDLLGGFSPELHGVMRSQAEGTAYFVRFQSAKIVYNLQQVESLLKDLDKEEMPEKEGIVQQLHTVMWEAKRESQGEPEYHLMLAAMYASRGLWFEAYLAADQGLRRLHTALPPPVGIDLDQVEFEAQLLKGAALHHWALTRYGDLPQFAGQFLEEAAECVRKALTTSSREIIPGPLGTRRDPRALRELATIYGNAREVEEFSRRAGRLKEGEKLLIPDECDLELAGLPTTDVPVDLFQLYRALAERAYEGATNVPSMRVSFVNTLLFALVEEDEGKDSDRKSKLVGELDELNAREEYINCLDTLAWFYYRRARHTASLGSDPSADLRRAKEYVGRARAKLQKSKRMQRFFTELVRARENEIRNFESAA
jgi:hypothetical protein